MKWNMHMGVQAPEFFQEAEVNDMDHAHLASNTHKNVTGF